MADLLRWSVGMALPKKKDENNNSVISSLKMMGPTLIKTNTNNNQTSTVNNATSNANTVNNPFSYIQQINERIRQQAEQRRQQEEQQRQQQIERARQEQEERQRKENEQRLQQQQAFQQKQNNLLNSSLRGGNLLSTLSNQNNLERRMNPVKTESDISYDKWLGTTSMDNLSKEMEKAKADNNTDWIRRIQQYSGKNSNDFETYRKQSGLENSELNLGRSAATSLRDINDTRTYDTIDVNDSDNVRYFGRQNLLKKAFKAALGDNAEVGNMSYRDVINTYNNASGDQQADIKKAIADEIVNQREYAKKGNQYSLKSIDYLSDLNALLNEYGTDKGKSFGKQLGDWLSTGGFVGNIGGNALTEALGNITGNEDATKAHLEKQQNTRADLGAVGAMDTALTGIANTAMNLGTGGWYGIANAGVNTANAINGLDDKVLTFDENGKSSLRDKETGEKLSELGSAGINAAFALAGKAGIGPALGSGSAKDILKYAWQEPLWAGGTTLAQEGFSNLGKGKEFGDYDWGKVGQSFIGNLGQDIGMDLFNLGRGKAQAKIASQQADNSLKKLPQNSNTNQFEDGTAVKVNPDGSTSKLTDSEFAKAIENDTISNKKAVSQSNGFVDNNMDGILAKRLVDNNMDGVISPKSKLKAGVEAVKQTLTGQNRLQPAYAGVESGYTKVSNSRSINDIDTTKNSFSKRTMNDGTRYVELDGKLFKNKNGTVKTPLEAYNALVGKTLTLDDGSEVKIVKKLPGDKNIYNELIKRYPRKENVKNIKKVNNQINGNIDEVLEQSNFLYNKEDVNGRHSQNGIKSFDTRVAKIYDGDQAYKLTLSVAELNNGEKIGYAKKLLKPDVALTQKIQKESSTSLNPTNGESSRVTIPKQSISQKAQKVQNGINKLADLSYDVSTEVGNKTKKAIKKAADIANEHPLGGTIKPTNSDSTNKIDWNEVNRIRDKYNLLDTNVPEDKYYANLKKAAKELSTPILQEELRRINKSKDKYSSDKYFERGKNIIETELTHRNTASQSNQNIQTENNEPLTTAKENTRKLMNLSGLEDANKTAINGKKMTTEQFFDANKIGSNDLTALKQNYPKEVQSVKKLIKAGVTPETFNNKVLNSDGTAKTAYKYQDIPAMRAMFEMSYNYNKATDVGVTKDQTKANLFSEDAIKENTTNKSSFARKTGYNQNFSEETRNALANDPVEYKPTTNEERLARANEILSSKSLDQVDAYLRDNYFNTTESHRNSGDTVLAGEFAKMLDADGQYGRATEIVQKMSEIATKQGQQIQALSIISNRTPEGIANMAQNAIQKGGGKVDGELRKQILSNTQEIGRVRAKMAELSAENDDISYKIMNGKGDLSALRKRQMAIAQEYRTCLDQEGRDFAKLSETVNNNSPRDKSVFGSVWRAGLLSGPRTHVGNAVSNTFQNALNAGADRIASSLDWARSKITGGEREVVTSDKGLRTRGKGLKRGLSAAGEVMKTGTNLWEGTEKVTSNQPNAWGYGGELSFKNKIADTMVAKPTNFIFRAMSAGDLPFRYSAFENAIRTEAKRQGMNQGYKGQALQDYINSRVATPDPDLRNYGIQKGNESVYDADTFLSKTMSALDKQINKIDNKVGRNAAKTAKTLIAPFVKVPSKVLSTAIDYSPVGAVQAVVKKVGGSKNYSVGQFETDIAKSGLGTGAFVGLGYALSSAGLLTGGYPDDKDERNRWKAEGIEPNSIKIGDKYVSLNYLGPAAILMGMGAGVQKRQEQGQDPFTVAVGSIGDTFNAFFEQSYVQGLNSAINAVKDSQRYGESYANSLARGLVPNLLRQTAVATDSKQRQVNNPLEAITSGIPGLSQTLDAKVDAYGREIENKQTLPLGQMWDALKISNSRETNDVIDEVSRLHSVDPSNKELQVTPPMEDNTLSVNGTNVKITDSQKTQLQKDVGEAAITAMRQVMQSSQYASLSDTEKAAALDKARSNAQTQARKQFIEANGITAENNSENTNSGGSVEGDYASKAISSVKSSGTNKNGISVNDSLSQEYKDILSKYNSMSSDDWNNYLYGSTADSAAAEYKLARAKYENDLANGDITDTQKIKKQKELAKLAVSQQWTKDYRDAYSLAGSKSDMQAFLNELDDETRAKTVATLNGLNNAMYEAGVITESTYKTRANAINNTTSKKSSSKKSSGKSKSGGMSSAEASALSSLAKTMAKGSEGNKVKTTSAPNTKRKMSKTKSSGGQSSLASYSTNLATNVTVNKGAKRSIG